MGTPATSFPDSIPLAPVQPVPVDLSSSDSIKLAPVNPSPVDLSSVDSIKLAPRKAIPISIQDPNSIRLAPPTPIGMDISGKRLVETDPMTGAVIYGVPKPPLPEGLKSDEQVAAEAPSHIDRFGNVVKDVPMGHSFLDFPYNAYQYAKAGVEALAEPVEIGQKQIGERALRASQIVSGQPLTAMTPTPSGFGEQVGRGVHELASGAFEAATPFIAADLAVAPVKTIAYLAGAAAAQKGVQEAARASGVGPNMSAVLGDAAALGTGLAVRGWDELGKKIDTQNLRAKFLTEYDRAMGLGQAFPIEVGGQFHTIEPDSPLPDGTPTYRMVDVNGRTVAQGSDAEILQHIVRMDAQPPAAPNASATPTEPQPTSTTTPQPAFNESAFTKAHNVWNTSRIKAISKYMQENPGANEETATAATSGTYGTEPKIADFAAPPPPPPAPEPAPKPEPPAKVGKVSKATPNAPTAATPTEPESPETIAIQMQQMGRKTEPLQPAQRKVVMFPGGEGIPDLSTMAGLSLTHDAFGNVYAYRPDLISEGDIHEAAKKDRLPEILGHHELGMGTVDKKVLAEEGLPLITVVTKTADGVEVQSTLTNSAHLDDTLKASNALKPEGGSVHVVTPEEAIASRNGQPLPTEVPQKSEFPQKSEEVIPSNQQVGPSNEPALSPEPGAPVVAPEPAARESGASETTPPVKPLTARESSAAAKKLGIDTSKFDLKTIDGRKQLAAAIHAARNPQPYPPAPVPGVETTTALEPWFLGEHEGRPVTPERLADINDRIKNRPDDAVSGRGPKSVGPGESFNQFKDPLISHIQKLIADYQPGTKILNVTHYRDIQATKAWLKAGARPDRAIDTDLMTKKGDQEPGGLYLLDEHAIAQIQAGRSPGPDALRPVEHATEPGIYELRHGATEWNAENKNDPSPNAAEQPGNESAEVFRGSSNIDLAPQGVQEAHNVAGHTAGQFTKIYSSPLKRAQDTARIVVGKNPQVLRNEPVTFTVQPLGGGKSTELTLPPRISQQSITTANHVLSGITDGIRSRILQIETAVLNTPHNVPVLLDGLQKSVNDSREFVKLQADPEVTRAFTDAIAAADRLLEERGDIAPAGNPAPPAPIPFTGRPLTLTGDTYLNRRTIRQMAGAKWSKRSQSWTVSDTPDNRKQLESMAGVLVNGQKMSPEAEEPAPTPVLTPTEVQEDAFPPEVEDAPEGEPPHITLANAILRKLQNEEGIGNNAALQQMADRAFKGTRASGAYTLKEAHDAVEAAVNRYIADSIGPDLLSSDFGYGMERLRDLLATLPTQNVRTDEQIALQQFSTPPTLSFLAAKAAAILARDTVGEPSAGTGSLAAWAKAAGAKVRTNEIDDRRRDLLSWAVRGSDPTGVDAEILNATWPQEIQPTVIVMNPPFSATGGRVAQNSNDVGYKHVINGLARLQSGGRLVAILGEGARPDAPNARNFWKEIAKRGGIVRANVGISGQEYVKYGTAFGNRLIVVDKADPAELSAQLGHPVSLAPITGDFDTIEAAYAAIHSIIGERSSVLRPRAGTTGVGSPGGDLPGSMGGEAVVAGGAEQNVQPSGPGQTGNGVQGSRPGAGTPVSVPGRPATQSVNGPSVPTGQAGGGHAPVSGGVGAAGAAGTSDQSLIDDLVKALESEGFKRPNARPNAVPAPGPQPTTVITQPKVSTPLDAAAEQALKDLNEMLGLGGSLLRPREIAEQASEPIDPRIMRNLGLIGARNILAGATKYDDWSRGMVEQAAPILTAVSARSRMSGDSLLQEVHRVAAAVAKQFGVEAEPTPSGGDDTVAQPPSADDRISLESRKQEDLLERVEDDGAYVQYVPTINGPAHPGVVVETKIMASVDPPPITYQPNLPADVIANSPKPLSAVQLESIARAGQAHESFNESGERLALLLGDGCVAAGTKIYDPIRNEHTPIEVLVDRESHHFVLSLTPDGFVPRVAECPFLKGTADLYRVSMDNGRTITVTDEHKFLTPDGWRTIRQGLQAGSILALAETGQCEDHVEDHDALPENAQSCFDRPQDCLDRYWPSRQISCDELSHQGKGSDQEPFPLLADALGRTHLSLHRGDRESLSSRIHQGQSNDHRARSSFSPSESRGPSSTLFEDGAMFAQSPAAILENVSQSHVEIKLPHRSGDEVQSRQFFSLDSYSTGSVFQISGDSQLHSEHALPYLHNSRWNRIRSVVFVERNKFYDMYVPGPQNYVAEGFVNHNTGLGKGQEIAGIIWDNNRSGRKRAIWVSGSADLIGQAKGDFIGVGATDLSKQLYLVNDWKPNEAIDAPEGVLFSTHTTLAMDAPSPNAKSRRQQIMDWLGPDGVIIFDEAAKAKNAVPGEQVSEGSKAGKAVVNIQKDLPKARVVYVSATAATEVRNLGYMTRMGIWGRGTPFHSGFQQFMAEVGSGGIAAMELIAREMKAAGRYLSRSISYKGVTFKETIHNLTPEQEVIYDSAAEAWQDVLNKALDQVDDNGGGERQKRAIKNSIWGENQRFYRALLTAMKMPTLFEMVDKALADPDDPRAVIISLIGTGEAQGKRQIAQATEENDDLDFSPREILINVIRKVYPVHMMEEYTDPETGETGLRKVTGPDGKLLENPEAVANRQVLIDRLTSELALPEGPLDQIISTYGRQSVAEITSRRKTIQRNPDTGKWEAVSRAPDGVRMKDINNYEMNQFQDGKKNILVMSKAGGTGFSFHADLSRANQRRRLQIALELSWAADDQLQAFGRGHRSNQRVTPEFEILSTNAGGERRFSSSIARRLESLGALTKGQRDASGGSSVLAKYNFETDQGIQAANSFYNYLLQDPEVEGSPWNGLDILRKMGVLDEHIDEKTGEPTAPPSVGKATRENVTRLLNRILNVQVRAQNGIYNLFTGFFDEAVQAAIEAGRLDTGVNLVRGDHIRLQESRPIATDPTTKAKTYRYIVEVERKNKPVPVEFVRDLSERQRGHMMKRREFRGADQPDQLIWVERSSQPITTRGGSVERAYRYFGPGHRENARDYQRIAESDLNQNYEPMEGEALVAKLKTQDNTIRTIENILNAETLTGYHGPLPLYSTLDTSQDIYSGQLRDSTRANLKEGLKKEKKTRNDIMSEIRSAREGQWDLWQKAFDSVPDSRTDRIDMIGGSVMRVWSHLHVGRGRMDIRIAYPDSGGSITGVVMSEGDANAVESALTGRSITRTPESVFRAALQGAEQFTLVGGMRLQQWRINRQPVIEVITSDPYAQRYLKANGVRKEIVNYRERYYVPNDESVGVPIIEKILKQFPVASEGRGSLARPRADLSGPVWYSQLEKTIADKMPAKASPAQVAAIVGNPQNRVKADEVKWTGLTDWLRDQKGMVTKDEVLAFVRANYEALIPGQPGHVYVNQAATELIAKALGESGGLWGVTLTPKDLQKVIDSLMKFKGPFEPAAHRILSAINDALNDPSEGSHIVTIVDAGHGVPVSEIQKTRREEAFHRAQMLLGMAGGGGNYISNALMDSPGIADAVAGYQKRGIYDRQEALAELGAALGDGRAEELGLTQQQATDMFRDYVDRLIAAHGPEAGRILKAATPQVRKALGKDYVQARWNGNYKGPLPTIPGDSDIYGDRSLARPRPESSDAAVTGDESGAVEEGAGRPLSENVAGENGEEVDNAILAGRGREYTSALPGTLQPGSNRPTGGIPGEPHAGEPESVSRTTGQGQGAPKATSITLGSGLGGLQPAWDSIAKSKVVSDDIIPAAKAVKESLSWRHALQSVFAPQTINLNGKDTYHAMRAMYGKNLRAMDRAHAAFDKFRKWFYQYPSEYGVHGLSVIDRIETPNGEYPPDGVATNYAHAVRREYDQRWNRLKALGRIDSYLENYYTHLYKDPAKAKQFVESWQSRRPLAGSENFRKQRVYPTLREALGPRENEDGTVAPGLTAKFDNPVDFLYAGLAQMDKAIHAYEFFNEQRKYLKFSRHGAPANYPIQIDDKMFTVFGPRKGAVSINQAGEPQPSDFFTPEELQQFNENSLPSDNANWEKYDEALENWEQNRVSPNDVTVHGQRIMGRYYAPDGVGQVINNHLSPRWKGKPFDVYMATKGVMNALQLGGSYFHFITTAINSMISEVSLGIQQGAHGKPIEAAKSIARGTILAPVTIIRDQMLGKRLISVWDGTAKNVTPQELETVFWLQQAGNSPKQAAFNMRLFRDDLMKQVEQRDIPRVALRLLNPLLYMEWQMSPIMNKFVPQAKAAAFMKGVQEEMLAHPQASLSEIRERAAKIADDTDNLFGQLNQNNMMMRGWANSLMNVVMGRPGWTIGSLRVILGGAYDLGKSTNDAFHGRPFDLTRRSSSLLAMIAVGMLIGAIVNRALTGEWPQEPLDFAFPRTGGIDEEGNPARLVMPGYFGRDMYNWARHPQDTFESKIAGPIQLGMELARNRDYRHHEIYGGRGDNAIEKGGNNALDVVKYMIGKHIPYSAQGIQKNLDRGNPLLSAKTLLPTAGIQPASQRLSYTRAQQMIAEWKDTNSPEIRREASAHTKARSRVIIAARQGTLADANKIGQQEVDAHHMSWRDVNSAEKIASLGSLASDYKNLASGQKKDFKTAIRVYDAATGSEKQKISDEARRMVGHAQPWDYMDQNGQPDTGTINLVRKYFPQALPPVIKPIEAPLGVN